MKIHVLFVILYRIYGLNETFIVLVIQQTILFTNKCETSNVGSQILETNAIFVQLKKLTYLLYGVDCNNLPILTQHKTCIGQYIDTELYALGQ